MGHWKRWLFLLIAVLLGFCVLALVSSIVFVDFLVDLWWFNSLGYGFYFWQRYLYGYVVAGGVWLLFFLIFFLNFWVASRYLGTTAPPTTGTKLSGITAYRDLLKMFRTGSLRVYTPLSIILPIPIALPLFRQWEAFLLYVFAPESGIREPIYGKDISYYLFSYPIYTLLERRLLLAFGLLFLGLVLLYWLERRVLHEQEGHLPKGAKIHLSCMVLLLFLIETWDYFLQLYRLLYTASHQPLFFGPGFVEMNVIQPLIYVSLLLLVGTAFSLIYFIHTKKGVKVLVAFAACFAIALGLRYWDLFHVGVERYIVKPNEISREAPFIQRNIEATLSAYNLDRVETRDFEPERVPVHVTAPQVQTQLRNIPVWDGDLLDDVYRQLQQLRTYYDFPTVDVDRYTVNGLYQQVFLGARELDLRQIPPAARNWVNDHLSYTHGYGMVMTPASQGGDEPLTWFIRGIPPESEFGFNTAQPGIYFGLESYPYAIAPNDAGEIEYPKGSSNVITSYGGEKGVPVSSIFRKLLFAFYFKDMNLFLTTKTNERSQVLFRRNIIERIRTITPYLTLDRDPYLVVTGKKLYWLQDAYTTSDMYPFSTPYPREGGEVNYIRNSVKIVVDAYEGTVDYYIFDTRDPIAAAYNRMYPGVFKNYDKMPADLASHVRYPLDIFTIQMSIYAKYHQTDPEVFYQQEDVWEFAKTFRGDETPTIEPYYLTLDLIEPPRFDFLMLAPMSPRGRDNLRALAVVSCDQPHYGKIIVYSFPKGELVYGPSQIHALINQDTRISEQFTLWDQVGSQVGRGKMIILPIGKVILYIQPVYLKSATQLKIPELKRLIMSQGQIVVMEKSLEEAYDKMQARIKAETERVDKRFAPLMTEPPPQAEGGSQ